MSRNRPVNTKPEVRLRKACWARGMRYRLGAKLPGKPDFTLLKYRVVVFVDGCFWHGCPIHYQRPATRSEFWAEKVSRNRSRDLTVTEQLRGGGWTVVRIWEHTVRQELDAAVAEVIRHCDTTATPHRPSRWQQP